MQSTSCSRAALIVAVVCLQLLFTASSAREEWYDTSDDGGDCFIQLSAPMVVLKSVPFDVEVTLPPFLSQNETIPLMVYYNYSMEDDWDIDADNGSNTTLYQITRYPNGTTNLVFTVTTNTTSLGHDMFEINFSGELDSGKNWSCSLDLTVFSIPGVLTIFPPIIAALLAILFRQVILALLVGIWLCAFLANRYNPLTGILRTLDTYFVGSIGDFGHAEIIVFTFILGGMIGVVQKAGGGLGLAKLICRFTNSRRKAAVTCLVLCCLIFFDDYSLVLIAGTSLRTVMSSVGVSREKYAFILQSLAPVLPSTIPISSWIGVQVGYMQSALGSSDCNCPSQDSKPIDPFIFLVRTIPYRFFPLLMLFTVTLVCFLGRDFGPMLTAERASRPNLQLPLDRSTSVRSGGDGTEKEGNLQLRTGSIQDEKKDDNLFEGPLAPKKNVPYRWFNAAVPFLITIVVTVLGMVLGGRQAILDLPDDANVSLSVVNIFSYADSVASLIWATSLACVVLLVMLLIQRIFSIKEYMSAWMEGVKDVIEPTLIYILAWALGTALQDIGTSKFIAQALQGHFQPKYLPPLVTVLGFFMSFATGSAFGTMGILFPVAIPIACQLTECDQDSILQTSAAILSSSIFGNVISPLADITILTTFAAQVGVAPHIKTAALYACLVAAVSILFGALPVGAHWYPWYAAWGIMAAVVIVFFVLFSSNFTSLASQPLLKRIFPRAYNFPAQVCWRVELRIRASWDKLRNKTGRPFHPNAANDDLDTEIDTGEKAPLLGQPPKTPPTAHHYSTAADTAYTTEED